MSTSLVLALVVSLAAAGPSPVAGQQSASAFEFSVNRHGIQADSQDRKVPADSRGVIAAFGGYAWWQAFTYCSAIHSEEARRLAAAGETAPSEQARSQADRHLQHASLRLGADRSLDPDRVIRLLGPELSYQELSVLDAGRPYVQEAARCRMVEVHHGRTGA